MGSLPFFRCDACMTFTTAVRTVKWQDIGSVAEVYFHMMISGNTKALERHPVSSQSHHRARELSLERREGRREILETSLSSTRSLYVSGTKVAMPSGFMFMSHSHIARTHV